MSKPAKPSLDDPLDEAELDRLDAFLLARIEALDDDVDDEADLGVLCVSELDGFLTAIVSGPLTVPPSRWIEALWGKFPPEYASEEQLREVLESVFRLMNGIAGMLMEEPDDFEPIFLHHEAEGREALVVDEWCTGYLRGMRLTLEAWEAGGTEVGELLAPILLFATEIGFDELELMNDAEVEAQQQLVGPAAVALHGYWLEQRQQARRATRSEPKVGRNDPCPCGSGKKYKKCCLH
ncbi:MAG TPA: UPF0149 family protein [Gammaproteobacteria bacterium]